MPCKPDDQLSWLAFLYVAGELTFEEATQFELRMANDQDAREAVLEAVELAQALLLQMPPVRLKKQSRRRVLAWSGSLVMAAGLMALLVIPATRFWSTSQPEVSTVDVAQAWSGLRAGSDPDWIAFADASHVAQPSTTLNPGDSENAEDDAAGTSTERALPSWLLSAASSPLTSPPILED